MKKIFSIILTLITISTTITFAKPMQDTSLNLNGARYAYIFGYEPIIREIYDKNGNVEVKVEIAMGMDDDVTVEQVSSMLMRMLDQNGNTMDKEYPIVGPILSHQEQWYTRGLAYLYSVGGFDEDDAIIGPITRGQVAKLASCALKLNLSSKTSFKDINDCEYKEYIEKVYHYGYMKGVNGNTFNPNGIMTRAEFCTMFNRIIGRHSNELHAIDDNGKKYKVTAEDYCFVDMNPKHWAYTECLKATSAYDENGYIDMKSRTENIRNILDHYNGQIEY